MKPSHPLTMLPTILSVKANNPFTFSLARLTPIPFLFLFSFPYHSVYLHYPT